MTIIEDFHRAALRFLYPALLAGLFYRVVRKANKPDAVNPAMALRFAFDDQWRRVTDLERSAMKGILIAVLTIVSLAHAGDDAIDQKIRALIEKLAISAQPASKEPFVTYDNPRNAELVKQVHSTANELEKFGMAAFPHLIAHLNDSRQSVPFRRVLPSTVGDACLSIVMRQIYALPDGYSDTASLYRRGADGKLHEQPVWSKQIYDGIGAHKWLTDRKDKTLRELQLEAIEWVLKIQKEIGARTTAEREQYIAPLEAQAARLRREYQGGAANGSQPICPEANRTSSAAGSRR